MTSELLETNLSRNMKRFYTNLTRILDTGLLGVLIGLETGLMINIATGEKEINVAYQWSILLLSIAVIALIILLKLRQSMDEEVAKRYDASMSPKDRWAASCRYDERLIRFGYLILLLVCLAGTYFAIVRESQGNSLEASSKKDDDQNLKNQLIKIIQLEKEHLKADSLLSRQLLTQRVASKLDTLQKSKFQIHLGGTNHLHKKTTTSKPLH
ncbi:MAG: hypothetical protein JWQ66_368 [Mucilaginibacter sp.]|nr:hypothetical protein [Mucilaginibacter sp.]